MSAQTVICSSCSNSLFGDNDTVILGRCGHLLDEPCFAQIIRNNGTYYCPDKTCNRTMRDFSICQLKDDRYQVELLRSTPTPIQLRALELNERLATPPATGIEKRVTKGGSKELEEIHYTADALFLREHCNHIHPSNVELEVYLYVSTLDEKEANRFLRLCCSNEHGNSTSLEIFEKYQSGQKQCGCIRNVIKTAVCAGLGYIFCSFGR